MFTIYIKSSYYLKKQNIKERKPTEGIDLPICALQLKIGVYGLCETKLMPSRIWTEQKVCWCRPLETVPQYKTVDCSTQKREKYTDRQVKESWEEKSQDTEYRQGFKKDWQEYDRIKNTKLQENIQGKIRINPG